MGAKAVSGASSMPLSAVITAVVSYFANIHPPQEIVLAIQALVTVPLTYVLVYFTPHTP